MSNTRIGLFVGLLLGIVITFGGFVGFIVVIIFGAIGLGVGRAIDGKLDLQAIFNKPSDRR